MTTLQRLGVRAPLILPGAGWLNAKRDRPERRHRRFADQAHHATFVDKNGNFQADPGEDRRAWELAATAVKKDARVFVLADSDCSTTRRIRVGRQQLLALDVSHWLIGDEAFTGDDLDRGRRADHPHPQAGRGLVLLDDLPGARRW